MKLPRFIFRDFWRKLVALIFAVVIYWQVDGSIKRKAPPLKPGTDAAAARQVDARRTFTVRMLARSIDGKRVFLNKNSAPKVSVTLRGAAADIAAVRDGDLLFYVDGDEWEPGKGVLPVRWHIRRSGISVSEVSPAEMKIDIDIR